MKKRVISIDITVDTFQNQMAQIINWAVDRQSTYVCVANVHMLVEAHKDPKFADVVNQADLATADGMPIAKSLGFLYKIDQERVAGVEIIEDLLAKAEQQQIKVGFYGGTQDIQDETKKFIQNKFPNLPVTQYRPHPFRDLADWEEEQLAKSFNDDHTQILFVASGCPRQEKWMNAQKGKINACMIGIGGALNVVTGLKKNAPQWMRDNSLEWLYRLMLEPKRLFRRYAITNSTFLWLLAKAMIKK